MKGNTVLRRASVLVLVVGMFSVAGSAAEASTSTTWGTWTLYGQDYSNWCWSAGAKTIVQHEKGTSSTECQYVKWGLNSTACSNSTGTLSQMITAMSRGGLSNPGAAYGGSPYWSDLRTETVNGHGMLGRVMFSGVTGHIAPMVGTSETGGVAKVYLVYIQVNAVSGSWVVWDQYLAGSAGLGGVAYSPTHYVSGMRG